MVSSSSSNPFFFILFSLARFGPHTLACLGALRLETATPNVSSHFPPGIVLCPSRMTLTLAFHFFAWPMPQ